MRQPLSVPVALVLVSIGSAPPAPAQQAERHVFVTVLDQAGAPILDLGPGDFQVQEDGLVRPIVRVGLANDPMRVALLVDNSDAASRALVHIRTALNMFPTRCRRSTRWRSSPLRASSE
jgi:hypothetical protein